MLKRFTFIAIQLQIQHYFCRAGHADIIQNKNPPIRTSAISTKGLIATITSFRTTNYTN